MEMVSYGVENLHHAGADSSPLRHPASPDCGELSELKANATSRLRPAFTSTPVRVRGAPGRSREVAGRAIHVYPEKRSISTMRKTIVVKQ